MTDQEYDLYPAHNHEVPDDVFDRKAYNEKLELDAGRLFSTSDIDISITCRDGKTSNVSMTRIECSSDLDSFLEVLDTSMEKAFHQYSQDPSEAEGKELCFIFKQLDSWNHILSTSSVMKKLLAHFDVFPPFLNHLHSFGLRHNAIGEELPTISLQNSSPRNDLFELCFDLRYPEENGRHRGDPWSIRHTAMYYQYDRSKDMSTSILIQPSKRLQSQVVSLLTSSTITGCRSALLQHALFVSSGFSWQKYVVSLEGKLEVLEVKAYFSKVGVKAQHDYDLVFKDYQNLQRLRKKLLITQELLGANIEVCKQYQKTKLPKRDLASGALDWYAFQLEIHQRTTCRLLKTADGVGEALLCILKYRNDEAAQVTTSAIHENGRTLTELVTLSNQNANAVSKLTQKAQRDTRSTKVLTLVASLYLPATLVASVFNSNLVGPSGSAGNGESALERHFAAARDFWMFPVFAAALTILTMSPVLLYMRRPTPDGSREIA